MNKILLMGPQGAGKGTAAEVLTKKLGIPHISMGDIFRETVKSNSPLAKKLKEIMEKGELVPLEITAQMIKERLAKDDCKKGYILDGYPRNTEQAEIMDQIDAVDLVAVLEVSRQVSIERLTTRIQCRNCGKLYNTRTMQPKKEGVCDLCKGELYQRDDDKEEAIIKRLEIYEKETSLLKKRYQDKLLLINSAKNNILQVVDLILKALKN